MLTKREQITAIDQELARVRGHKRRARLHHQRALLEFMLDATPEKNEARKLAREDYNAAWN